MLPPEWHETGGAAPDPDDTPGFSDQPNRPAPIDTASSAVAYVPFARPVVIGGDYCPPAQAYRPRPLVRGEMPWWRALLEVLAVLLLALLGEVFILPLPLFWHPADPRWFNVAGTVVKGLAVVLLCTGFLRFEGRRLSSIGWTSRGLFLNLLIGLGLLGFAFCMLVVTSVILRLYVPGIREHEDDAAKAIKAAFPDMRLTSAVAFMFFVAVWEETAFRGFILTRLQGVFRRWWVTIPVGAVLFGIGHGYQGPLAIPLITLVGVLLGTLAWWRKSLVPCVVLHALFNILNFLLLNA